MTTVNLCRCVLARLPRGVEIVSSAQLPPRLDTEKREAVFLVSSDVPWNPGECDCRHGVIHVQQPLNAAGIAHGGANHSTRSTFMIHAGSLQEATDTYRRYAEGGARIERQDGWGLERDE